MHSFILPEPSCSLLLSTALHCSLLLSLLQNSIIASAFICSLLYHIVYVIRQWMAGFPLRVAEHSTFLKMSLMG